MSADGQVKTEILHKRQERGKGDERSVVTRILRPGGRHSRPALRHLPQVGVTLSPFRTVFPSASEHGSFSRNHSTALDQTQPKRGPKSPRKVQKEERRTSEVLLAATNAIFCRFSVSVGNPFTRPDKTIVTEPTGPGPNPSLGPKANSPLHIRLA